MDSLKCTECNWEGDRCEAYEHLEAGGFSTLLCPRCFGESLEEVEGDGDDEDE